MKRLGIVVHWNREDVVEQAQKAITWCEQNDVQPLMLEEDAGVLKTDSLAVSQDEFAKNLDACLSIGGDGTMLRAVDYLAVHGVPVIGVNAGRLAYLTDIDFHEMEQALQLWIEGKLVEEKRMMIRVDFQNDDSDISAYALNEMVIYRADSGRSIILRSFIDDKEFINYAADGVILSTPTGSTAYSLAAGGPIVEAGFEALVMTPVAAHTAFNRSMVLAPQTVVKFIVEGHRSADITIDGRQIASLSPGQSLTCTSAGIEAHFLRLHKPNFIKVLKDRFRINV